MGLLNDDDTKELTEKMSATMEKEFTNSLMNLLLLSTINELFGEDKAIKRLNKISEEFKKQYIEQFEKQRKHMDFPFESLGIDIKEQLNHSLTVLDKTRDKIIQALKAVSSE